MNIMQRGVIGAQSLTDTQRRDVVFFIIISGFLLFSNTFVFSIDDLAHYYSEDVTTSLWKDSLANYRYIRGVLLIAIKSFGLDYINIIGVLCLALPVAILLCVRQLLCILMLPTGLLVPCAAAILLHGLWADLYQLTMSYADYVLAMCFTALSLSAATKIQPTRPISWSLPVMSGLAVLVCYQPFLVILPLAAGLLGLKLVLSRDDSVGERRDIRLGCILVAVFAMACALFLVVVSVVGNHESYRPVSMMNIPRNIGPYLGALVGQLLPGTPGTIFPATIFPLHQRVIYSFLLPGGILIAAGAAWQKSRRTVIVLGSGAAILSLLSAPGPFNLPLEVFWPSGRSTSPIAFFHVLGVALLLSAIWKHARFGDRRFREWLQYAVAIFIGLSLASHLSLLMERMMQTREDWAFSQAILAEMRRQGPLRPDEPLAVVGTWRNAAQLTRVLTMDYAVSGFSAPWSRVPVLRVVGGTHFTKVVVPESVCQGFKPPFEVRRHEDAFVVCLE